MTTPEAARQQIADLATRYAATPARTRAGYNESEIRHYFVLPLFRALGWNTENPAEFSAEEQISRGFVDFGFYLNTIPVFYLETKRVAQKLGTLDNVRQSINYSYLKGVTWAVLTDFEQLMVFNADWEERDPLKARFLDLRYDQYAGEGFDDLWLLSKPAMSAQPRAIDLQAERYGAKAKKEPVTRTLFNDLTGWRRALFNDIRQMRATLWATDSRAVDNAVQKLFDRLIFIRTVEDRGVEPNRLNALVRQTERRNRELYPGLLKLFRELDEVYNSNLFAQHALDTMEITDIGLLREIIKGLYTVQGGLIQYDFNAITADVLGGVYEQYLGFKATDPDAQLDTLKSRKRKSQGIYYTPQYVVRYIVANTLGRLLAEGANPDDLRVLDPACGSGSFLIEAFDVLDRAYAARHAGATPAERSAWRRRILTHNLYGVDLDDQAVEVTRLNLMLRAALERGKLPLLTNIRHGNSLIDDDAVAGAGLGFAWEWRFPEVFASHTLPLWFVTFVTHNSRVSERMVTYGVQKGEPVIFSPEEQLIMAQCIADACRAYGARVVAWNVLPDHVHMLLAAEDEETLDKLIGKIKGASSHAYKRFVVQVENADMSKDIGSEESDTSKGLKPLVLMEKGVGKGAVIRGEGTPIWAQKYNGWRVTSEHSLQAIIQYINTNHEKHTDRWGERLLTTWNHGLKNKGLQPLALQQPTPATPTPATPAPAAPTPAALAPSAPTPSAPTPATPTPATPTPATPTPATPTPSALAPSALAPATPTPSAPTPATPAPAAPTLTVLQPLVQTIQSLCIPPDQATHVAGGFDVVIGNPPYVRQETLGTDFKRYVESRYVTAAGTADLYVYFIEKGVSLLRPGGLYSVIVANKWLRARYGQPLRDWLKSQSLVEIVDFGDLPVFPDAVTYPCILTVAAPSASAPTTPPADPVGVVQVRSLDFASLDEYAAAHRYVISRGALDGESWSLADDRAQAVLDKLRAAGVPLGEYVGGKIHRGVLTGLNEAFVIDAATRRALIARDPRSAEIIKPFLAGRDIKRYETPHTDKYLICIPNGWTREQLASARDKNAQNDEGRTAHSAESKGLKPLVLPSSPEYAWEYFRERYPAVAEYLEPFAVAAQKRSDQGEYWWELRPCDYYAAFEQPKIIYAEIATRGQFVLDTAQQYCDTTVFLMQSESKYLLGLLNSSLLTFVFSKISSQIRGGFLRWKRQYMRRLPIRAINFDDPAERAQHDRLVALVETMLALKRDYAAANDALAECRHELAGDIERTDRQIDALVYALYGLTDAEVALIEAGAGG